jgi:hypothetical protein
MNVNIWGPELWSLLHGLAGLTKSNIQKLTFIKIFQVLQYLLPCIYCRNSYKQFFDSDEITDFVRDDKAVEYVYHLHNLVNDKLEIQKIEKLFLSVDFSEEQKQGILENRLLFSSRPTIETVKKRFNLSNGKPFSTSTIYKTLFSFVLVIDIDEEDPKIRRAALADFIKYLSIYLSNTEEFFEEATKLNNIRFPFQYNSKDGFYAIFEAYDFEESFEDMFLLYSKNVPARSCDNLRCI